MFNLYRLEVFLHSTGATRKIYAVDLSLQNVVTRYRGVGEIIQVERVQEGIKICGFAHLEDLARDLLGVPNDQLGDEDEDDEELDTL